jgi:hypothetical protein
LSPIEGEELTTFEKTVGPLVVPCLRLVAFDKNALDNAVLSWAGADGVFGVFGCTLGCCQEEPKYEGDAKKDLK